MTIWKIMLKIEDEQEITVPQGAEFLHCNTQFDDHTQRDFPCVWFRCDPKNPPIKRKIYIHGTGHEMDPKARVYIGTFMLSGGRLVFHVFHN